ncbi:MAG: glycosyltransferase [Candidatus Poribacteria bacterium]|nr:glycosyltransferase [Candidatus Poribacteria bacterium]
MKTVLLTRHAGTEDEGSSLYRVFSGIEQIAAQNYNVIRLKPEPWSKRDLDKWILHNALQTDLLITWDPYVLKILRENGWSGKTILTALGGFPRGAANFRGAMPYLYQSDTVWCNSSADMGIYTSLVTQDGTQPEAVCIPFSVNEETFQPLENEETRQKLRSAWGVKPDDFVLIYAGRVTVEKNVHAIVEAVSEVKRLGYPIKLIIVGKIEDVPFREFEIYPINVEGKVNALIEASGISEHVTIYEWQTPSKLNELLNVADAFMNLTLHHDENFGLSQIEAMSAGLPVIGTAWGGLKDTIVNEEVGFSIDTWITTNGVRFDAPATIAAIKCLIESKKLREAQGQHARKRAVTNYSDSLYREQVMRLIETALNCPTEKIKPSFTHFGARFHQRFAWKGYPMKYSKSGRAPDPIYEKLSDPDYLDLIRPYTSRTVHKIEHQSSLFQVMTGHLNGDFFVSEDLLYSIRIPVSPEESEAIKELSRWQGVPRKNLNYSDDTLASLMQKGVIGISKEVQ